MGTEIFKDLPDIHSVVVSVGGGGLLSGLSLAIKNLKPSVKIYGVVWEGTPDFCQRLNQIKKGQPCLCQPRLPLQDGKSGLTDGIAVKKSSREIGNLISPFVEEMVCVSEEEISRSVLELLQHEKRLVEGSGVAGLAGLLKCGSKWDLGQNCCVVISGANIDQEVLAQIERHYGPAFGQK